MKLGSLFDGSGGFPLAGKLNGIIPVWSSEIEPYPILVTHKNLPEVKHYGDISKLSGAELEPVDIITFGSPCQDLSQAGKRKGIKDGERSNLFFQAIRIIEEMREATNGKYPKYAVWENVPGAFSSNKGEDFRCVLEEFCKIKEPKVFIPKPQKGKGKWERAGEIMGDNYSVTWRTLDAQYWGVPQRRKRIYLVADFDGGSSSEILFKSESMSRNFGQVSEKRQETSRTSGESLKESDNLDELALFGNHGQGDDYTGPRKQCTTITASYGMGGSTKPFVVSKEKEMFFNNSSATDYKNCGDKSPTVISRYGTGGNTQPFVVENGEVLETYDVRFTKDGYKNQRNNVYKTDTSRTLNSHPDNPDSNYGGIAIIKKEDNPVYCIDRTSMNCGKNYKRNPIVEEQLSPTIIAKGPNAVSYSLQGNMIGRKDENGPQGSGVNEDVSFTLNTTDKHAVVYSSGHGHYHTNIKENVANALTSGDYKDPPVVYNNNKERFNWKESDDVEQTVRASFNKLETPLSVEDNYTVRRLTPLECARLQGFPDWWTEELVYDEKTLDEETINFFEDVFEEHRQTLNPDKKKKTRKQIIKWLTHEHTDGDEYKMWGNGIALPCATFVLGAIKLINDSK